MHHRGERGGVKVSPDKDTNRTDRRRARATNNMIFENRDGGNHDADHDIGVNADYDKRVRIYSDLPL